MSDVEVLSLRRPALAAVACAIVASILPVFLIGALSVEIRSDVDYGEAMAGVVLAAFFGSSALISSTVGRWVDAVGPRRALSVALVGTTAVQLLLAAATTTPLILVVLAGVAGTANATAQLGANVFIAREMPIHRQGIGFAVKQSAMPAASLLAGLSLPLVALTFGWRWAFLAGGALAAVAWALVRTQLRDSPVAEPPSTTGKRAENHGPSLGALGSLAIASGFSTAAAITLGGFFVESATDAGVSAAMAGLAVAVGSIVSIVIRLGAGLFADRRSGDLFGIVAVMLALGALMSICFTFRTPTMQYIGVPLAFGAGWAWPGLFNLSVVRASRGEPGRATGITQTGTYVGAAGGPLLFGAVVQSYSFSSAWWLAAALGLTAAAAVLIGRAWIGSEGSRRDPAFRAH